jgi:hypothetical protein
MISCYLIGGADYVNAVNVIVVFHTHEIITLLKIARPFASS